MAKNDFEGWDEMDDDDDDFDDEREDDLTRIAASLLIEKGNVDGAERQLRRDHEMTVSEAQEIMDEAMALVLGNAPRELRQSFEAVVSWHRWNAMYQFGAKKKDYEKMTTAQKQMDALMARVH